MANVKVNKNVLVDLLKDEAVKEQIAAIIIEILGKDKGAILVALLEQLQAGQGTTTEPKKPWYKKLISWVSTLLPLVLGFFGKKK